MGAILRKALKISQLKEAFYHVADNNGQPGVDGESIADFKRDLLNQLRHLIDDVIHKRYRPQPLKRVWIPRPGKTPRPIGIPAVCDRVLQTSVSMVITPTLEEEFEECSYAYRKGRSVKMAVERIGALQRQGYRWVVEADIRQFFDSIPHDRLINELRILVPDEGLLNLVKLWIANPVLDDGQLYESDTGVPQGAPISPLLANLYLDHLDEAILDEDLALVRYADDFIILAKSEKQAEAALELTNDLLENLELKLNPLKSQVVNFDEGFKFLGWNFIHSFAVPSYRTRAEKQEQRNLRSNPPPSPSIDTEIDESDIDIKTIAKNLAPEPKLINNDEMWSAFSEAMAENPDWKPAEQDNTAPIELNIDPLDTPPATESTSASITEEPETDWEDDVEETPPAMPPASLQRTIYITDPAANLATKNRRLLVKREDEILLDLPATNVDQVVLFGRNHVTPAALICCFQHDIPVSYLSKMGKFYGRSEPPSHHSARLQQHQFTSHASGELDLPLAKQFVKGKLANSELILKRYSRHRIKRLDSDQQNTLQQSIALLGNMKKNSRGAKDLESLRGMEGVGAVAYFRGWRALLPANWGFANRQQRLGGDPINALMDLGYTLLHQSIAGLLQARGINPFLGHFHRPSSGHMALASDLMEEFRAPIIDSAILNACLSEMLLPEDFTVSQSGFVLKRESIKLFIHDIETRLNTERRSPLTGEKLDPRRIMDQQVRNLANCYRYQDVAHYQACVFK